MTLDYAMTVAAEIRNKATFSFERVGVDHSGHVFIDGGHGRFEVLSNEEECERFLGEL